MSWLPETDAAPSPEIAAAFERVLESRGWVSNLMRSLAQTPDGLQRFSALGHHARYGTALSERQKELVICIVGRRVPYAWIHHSGLARQAGVTEAELAAIARDETPAGLSPQDRALCDYAFAVSAFGGTPAPVRAAMLAQFSPRQVADATLLAAYYIACGAILMAHGVEVETSEVVQVELDWQRRRLPG